MKNTFSIVALSTAALFLNAFETASARPVAVSPSVRSSGMIRTNPSVVGMSPAVVQQAPSLGARGSMTPGVTTMHPEVRGVRVPGGSVMVTPGYLPTPAFPGGPSVNPGFVPQLPMGPDLVVADFKLVSEAVGGFPNWGYHIEVTIVNQGTSVAPACPFVIMVEKTKGPGGFQKYPCVDFSHNWTTGKSLFPGQSVTVTSTAAISQTWWVLEGSLYAQVNMTQNSNQAGGPVFSGGVNETDTANNVSAKIGFVNPFQQ